MDGPPELVASGDPAWTRPVVVMPTFGLLSIVAGALPSFSLSANLLVLGTGGALFWFGVSHQPRRTPPVRLAGGAVWWIVPVAIFVAVELTNFLLGSGSGHPTLSKLADPVLERYLPRSALFFGWVAGFWGLVRR